MQFLELLPILQTAIGPVILISGVGLLLLTMTNRFGRILDRTRELSRELRTARTPERERALAQLEILLVRAHIVRGAIAAASLSALLAAILIMVIFVVAVLRLPVTAPIVAVFVSCLAALVGSLVLFLRDVNLSLRALRLEVGAAADVTS